MEYAYELRAGALRIPCKCRYPEDTTVERVVIGIHGLGGSYDDPFQVSLAEEMELFYSASIRFCLPCHGDSSLEGEEFTLRGCMDSLMAVARDAADRFPEAKELCIFGTGFGAYLALITMDELRELTEHIKLVVQTPAVRMDLTVLAMCGSDRDTLLNMEWFVLPMAQSVTVTSQFYEELTENFAINNVQVPLLIIQCEYDPFIRMDDIHALRNNNEQSQLVIIPGTTHRFTEEGAWDMVLDLTRDWFEFGQVLLCDSI